jgi:hypothetical protein
MSLPAGQERVLNRMEGALQGSEPHLASMFAIFARLNAGEPVGPEPLAYRRHRRRRSSAGNATYAVVIIPVMFAMIIAGALLSGGARSANTCAVGYSVGGSLPLVNRPQCPAAGNTGPRKTASGKTASAPARRSCTVAALDAGRDAWTGSAPAFSPPAQTRTVPEDSTTTC